MAVHGCTPCPNCMCCIICGCICKRCPTCGQKTNNFNRYYIDIEQLQTENQRLRQERDQLRILGDEPSEQAAKWRLGFGDYWRDNLLALLDAFPECDTGDWYQELRGYLNCEQGPGSPNASAKEMRDKVRANIIEEQNEQFTDLDYDYVEAKTPVTLITPDYKINVSIRTGIKKIFERIQRYFK